MNQSQLNKTLLKSGERTLFMTEASCRLRCALIVRDQALNQLLRFF